jgi:hypothetical protein
MTTTSATVVNYLWQSTLLKQRRSLNHERLASVGGYQPMPNAICSGCGVVIVVLWLLLSS